jgi:hypothetical protein
MPHAHARPIRGTSALTSMIIAVMMSSCAGAEAPRPEPSVARVVDPLVEAQTEEIATAPEPAPHAAPPTDGFAWEPLTGAGIETAIAARWSVVIDVDEGARGRYESPYDRYVMTTPHCVDYCITIARVAAVAPSLSTARRAWDDQSSGEGGEPSVTIDEGTTASGILYSARRFTVRMGSPGLPGQTVHRLTEVSRFFAIVPLDASSHLACTGYVEHGVERIDDPALLAARAVCTSLRRTAVR